MKLFFQSHSCNRFCAALRLKTINAYDLSMQENQTEAKDTSCGLCLDNTRTVNRDPSKMTDKREATMAKGIHRSAMRASAAGRPEEVLDIDPGASPKDVQTAWRELSLALHPDKVQTITQSRVQGPLKGFSKEIFHISF